MQDDVTPYLPTPSEGDQIHSIIRGLLGTVPGVGSIGAELFGALVRAPFERRLQEWIGEVEASLRSLYRRDSTIESYLHSDVFVSVLLAATQAAVRAHHRDKRLLLANAVRSSAAPATISADLQTLFVRFVDEMTTTHVILLRVLEDRESDVASCESYEALHGLFAQASAVGCSREEFTFFCNDFASRVLARFSPSLDDFPGVASRTVLVTDDSGLGPKVVVTTLGRQFLAFVGAALETPSVPPPRSGAEGR